MPTGNTGICISHAQNKVQLYLFGADNLLKISTLKVAIEEVYITK